MGGDVLIGHARPEHAGEVLTVQRAAYLSEAQRYGDPFLPPLTQPLDELADEIGAGRRLVALLGPRVVGSVRGLEREGVLHVGRLAVAPDQQGRGIGGRLLAAVEDLAGPQVTVLALFTGAASDDNVRLYEGLGYRTVRHETLPQGPGLVHLHKPRTSVPVVD
jgi:GNAT superfamily N-acetyltransferase